MSSNENQSIDSISSNAFYQRLFINGTWQKPSTEETITVRDAFRGSVIAEVPKGTKTDVRTAVDAASRAVIAWKASPKERADLLSRIASGLERRSEELARLITSEVGMPAKLSARIQVGSPIAIFKLYASLLETFEFERVIENSLIIREPVGVVACITPWNYPLHQIAAKVAPALAAGCAIVLKPSEVAPLNAFVFADVVREAGVPNGVFNLVSGYGSEIGDHLVMDDRVDMVSFTGSTATGKRISELAAQSVKRVSLELGGKSAAVILDDADLPAAVKATVISCFLNSGQTCSALTRMLVPETHYVEAVRLACEFASGFQAGDPFDPNVRLGPLVSKQQQDRVSDYIKKGQAEGANVLFGGIVRDSNVVEPTIFGMVNSNHTIAQEEIFGPVLSIMTYVNEEQAIEIANSTKYGLSGAVWSVNVERALAVARRMRTGQVEINGGAFNLRAPFGGVKQSGHGRELGEYGLDEFLEYKAIQLKPNTKFSSQAVSSSSL